MRALGDVVETEAAILIRGFGTVVVQLDGDAGDGRGVTGTDLADKTLNGAHDGV